MAADLSYDVQVNTTQAERNLAQLQKSVTGLNTAFAGFKTALAGISLGAIISQAIGLADSITDISDSTGIATANILGLSRAMIDNGGSAEGAQKAILKLVGAIGEAADGGEDTQKAFQSIGISLNDLRTLSEQDILSKTIAGLANISDASQRSVLSTKLLGKEIRNVGLAGVAGSYAQATAESAKYAAAIKSAADAQGNIDRTLTDFKIALLDALRPITELVTSLNVGVEGFRKFMQAVIAVGAVLATVFVGGKIIAGVKLFYAALLTVAMGAKNLFELFRNLVTGFGALIRATEGAGGAFSRIWLVIKAVLVAMAELAGPAFTALKTIATPVLASVAGYWGFIQESTTGAINKLKEYLNYLPGVNFDVGPTGQGRGDPKEIANREAADKAAKDRAKELREVRDKAAEREMDRYRKLQAALTGQQQTYNQLNTEAQTFSNYLMADLKFQTSLLGMTEDQKEIAIALNNETQRYLQQQNSLQSKLADIQSQIGIEVKLQKSLKDDDLAASKDKVRLLEDEESNLQELSKTYYKLHISNGKALEDELKNQQAIKNAEAERISNLEYISERLKEQAASFETLGGILRGINDQSRDLDFEDSLTGLTVLEQQLAKVRETSRKAALEAGRAFAAGFESEDGLTPERAQQLADGLDQISEAYTRLTERQLENLETSRSWSAGWEEAFRIYAENANNSALEAKTYFDTFTGGVEDAMVRLVQTGKLSFKDLANSMIADFARIQAKKIVVGLFGGGGGGGGGGLFGNIFGGLFGGRSAGGAVNMSTPYVVGERGPELFVPGAAGNIIPNNQLGGNAPVMQNLTTVNYSIQAVDASSFRSLVARDPQFIYSVTEKGRRSQPTRSR